MADANTPTAAPVRPLLPEVLTLLAAHRPAFRQTRTAQRSTALALGWLGSIGRHTLSQLLLGLGQGEAGWTAWYRLFSRRAPSPSGRRGCTSISRWGVKQAPPAEDGVVMKPMSRRSSWPYLPWT